MLTEVELKKLRDVTDNQVCQETEWVTKEWADEHFGSPAEAEFVSTMTPPVVLRLLNHIKRQSNTQGDELTCEDIERLRMALSWVGYSTPESIEECAARSTELVRKLVSVILRQREARLSVPADAN